MEMRWGTTKDFVHPSKLDIFVTSSHGANMYMPKVFKNGISSFEKIEFQSCFIYLVYSQFWGGFWVLTWCQIEAPVAIMLGYIFKSWHMASFNMYAVPLGHLIWIFKFSIFSVVLHESHGLGTFSLKVCLNRCRQRLAYWWNFTNNWYTDIDLP